MSGVTEFRLPDVGEGIAEAEVVDWLVDVGDEVVADQVVVVVETDKSQVELPAPVSGTVVAIGPAVGEQVPVGTLLTTIASGDGTSAETAADVRRPRASPSVRKRALRAGVDLAEVTATGPGGRVLATDLDAHLAAAGDGTAASPQQTAPADTVVELRGVRRQVARAMTEALRIPHVHEFREVDATALLAAHATLAGRHATDERPLTMSALLVRACVWALQRHPSFNARFDAEREQLTQCGSVALGIATATDDGLLVPVIRAAERLSLRDTGRELDRLTATARDRSTRAVELTGGSCTMTNFGSLGAWLGTPVIRPPEVAIVGFGRIADRVVAVDGEPAVRPVLPTVAATDHRVNDGAHLAAFLADLAAVLEQPLLLLDQV